MVKKYRNEKKTSQTKKKLENNKIKTQTRISSSTIKLKTKCDKKIIKLKKDIDLDNYNSFVGPSISELINTLDKPLNNKSKLLYNSSLKIKFPSKINKRKFF